MSEKKIRWIGITGTMASGKSTLIALLKEMGYPVYDADEIARQLTQLHQKGYNEIVQSFGKDILNEDQTLNRKKLADIIFQDESKKIQLEKILHPLIRETLQHHKNAGSQISFAEVPLLFESGWENDFDECWLVTCSLDTCIKRCMENRHMTKQEVMQRIKTQMSVEEKRKKADWIIENEGTTDQLKQAVKERLKHYE